ncbi:MAG: hypothetical protein ACK5RL_01870 [Acidimicrobiales bacterium]
MPAERPGRNRLFQSEPADPEYYATLWGSRRVTRPRLPSDVAAPTGPRPSPWSWSELRRRSGYLIALAALLLVSQVVLGSLVHSEKTEPAGEPPAAPAAPTTTPSLPELTVPAGLSRVVEPPDPSSFAATPTSTDPVPVLLDADLTGDVDGTLALALLNGYRNTGTVDLLGVTLAPAPAGAAAYADAVTTFYGAGDTPIGVPNTADAPGRTGVFVAPVVGDPGRFPRDVGPDAVAGTPGVEDAVGLLRRLLAAAADNSVVVVATGSSTNLARLLASPADATVPADGRTLVASKVRLLSVVSGDPGGRAADPAVTADLGAAREVFSAWPTPVVVTPRGLGSDLPLATDALVVMPRADNSPLLEATRQQAANGLKVTFPYQQPSAGLLAVLAAVEGNSGFITVGGPGQVLVADTGEVTFEARDDGRSRLVQEPSEVTVVHAIHGRYHQLLGASG